LDRNHNTNTGSRGGGVLIAVKSNFKATLIKTDVDCVEQIFILLTFKSVSVVIGTVYLPPQSSLQNYELHSICVEKLIFDINPNHVILCGDYNIPKTSWSFDDLGLKSSNTTSAPATIISDSFAFLNLFQCNTISNTYGELLDLVFSTYNNLTVSLATTALITPDHYHPPLMFSLALPKTAHTEERPVYRDFKNCDYSAASQFFASFNWLATFEKYDANTAAAVFNDAIFTCIEQFVPLRQSKISNFPLWFSYNLKQLMFNKKKAHKIYKETRLATDYNKFSELRAKCKQISKLDYQEFINKTEHSLSKSPKFFWKYIRDLKQNKAYPNSFQLEQMSTSCPTESANLFSKYFSSVYNQPTPTHTPNLSQNLPFELPSTSSFSLTDVVTALETLKNNNSNGPDGISARLLYNCRHSLAFPIYLLYRYAFDNSTFPDVWKMSSITPILKSGDPSLVSNYRPISILPHLAKLFELVVYRNIKRCFNHILIDEQHGFRPGKSTITSSVIFTTFIAECLESGYQVDTITTDFKKAFDTVSHNILINELESMGVGNPLLSWLKSYITGRNQFVSILGTSSKSFVTTSGVPQGGHLSPLLFSLFVNSISLQLKQVKFLLYADDIKIFHKIGSPTDSTLLQSELDIFTEWVSHLGLTLNLSKCNVISFSRSLTPIITTYFLNGTELEQVSSIKDLGIIYSPNLCFSTHINAIVNRALKVLGFIIRNTKLFKSVGCLCTLYYALVRSLLEFGSVVWQPYLAKDQLRLERVQNKFLNFIAFKMKIYHENHDYSNIRQVLNIPTLSSRRAKADLNFLNSILSGSLDVPDLLAAIPFRVPSHSSRNQSQFYVPTHKTSYGHNHTLHRMLRFANNQ